MLAVRKEETDMATAPTPASEASAEQPMNLMELVPGLMENFFAFFRPGHQEGVVPSRIKELARLKIAALNDCDT